MTTAGSRPADKPLEGPCIARPEDMQSLVALSNQVFRPAPRPGDMGREFPILLGAANAENLHVFREAGRVVSHVGVLRQTIHTCGIDIPAACIGAVCTDPEYRKAGLASQLMDLAVRRSIDNGDVLMPISGKRTLYVSRGATSLGPQIRFKVPLSVRSGTGCSEFAVSAYEPGNWEELADLQRTEPVRYQWAHREPHLLEAIRSFGGICLLARRKSGQLAASLLFCVGHPMYNGEPGIGRVVQFLGDTKAIPGLLGLIASSGLKGLDWCVLASARRDVAEALLSIGASGKASITNWTVLILNLAKLVETIAPIVARSGVELTCQDGRLVVAAEGQSVSLGQPDQQVEMLFAGPSTWSAELAALPAQLRIACSGALPIPLPDYGINYV